MLAFVGCGGGANEDARLSLHEYTAQAGTICKEEMTRLRAIGEGLPPTHENVRRVMKQQGAVLETLTDRMSDLRPPERVESDVDQMLRSFASAAAGFEKVSEAEDRADAVRRFEEHVSPSLARALQIAWGIGIPDQSCDFSS